MKKFLSFCLVVTTNPIGYLWLVITLLFYVFGHTTTFLVMLAIELIAILTIVLRIKKRLKHENNEIHLINFNKIVFNNFAFKLFGYKVFNGYKEDGKIVMILSKKEPNEKDKFIQFSNMIYINKEA